MRFFSMKGTDPHKGGDVSPAMYQYHQVQVYNGYLGHEAIVALCGPWNPRSWSARLVRTAGLHRLVYWKRKRSSHVLSPSHLKSAHKERRRS